MQAVLSYKTHFKIALAMFFWGLAFVSGRHLTQNYHPFLIAFARFCFACAFLLPTMFVTVKEPLRLSATQVLKIVALGMTGIFAYNYFFFAGLALVPAGKASVIIATNPAITAFLATFLLGEVLNAKKALGVSLALMGAMIVITQGDIAAVVANGLGAGEYYLFGGVLCWVSYTLIGKIALKRIGPLQATALSCLAGTIFLAPFAWNHGLPELLGKATLLDWFHFFFLGFFATFLGFIWFNQGVKELGASKTASFINMVPVVGVACGFFFLGESVSWTFWIGAALVFAGIRLTQKAVG